MEESSHVFRNRVTFVDFTNTQFRPSIIPHLRINLNFSLTLQTSIWIRSQDSTILPFTGEGPSPQSYNYSAIAIIRRPSSYDHVREAIESTLGKSVGNHLRDDERHSLSELASDEVRKKFTTDTPPWYINLSLDFNLVVDSRHLTVSDDDNNPRMIPAADSSFRLLEKYVVDCSSTVGCCVCLEEFPHGATALRMPCSHVFHGGCIHEWLKRSHYCPLCRYEMPTK